MATGTYWVTANHRANKWWMCLLSARRNFVCLLPSSFFLCC